eukprot:TRINITY_DN7270_c0_g1_i1.p1 TRINITY_DN7270_c0_g1~~TRINITY_DN7270_c0_g1_i1.p1  ORF type:complete len:473 (-),score=92.95 TRINITY_DN7270_c0_g1_i1:30-1448(-)
MFLGLSRRLSQPARVSTTCRPRHLCVVAEQNPVDVVPEHNTLEEVSFEELEPVKVVESLDRYVVGQERAKNMLAIALRNRWRRKHLKEELRKEVIPKNILMIGKSGVGKTELARRIAQLSGTPFVKVEATKFSEVGYKGQDVDTIVKDLLDVAITIVKEKDMKEYGPIIREQTEQRLLQMLMGEQNNDQSFRTEILNLLRAGALEDVLLEYSPPKSQAQQPSIMQLLSGFALPSKAKQKPESMTVAQIRQIEEEAVKKNLFSYADTVKRAINLTQEYGIAFIDEIDKLASGGRDWSTADASAEGVQRDLLPLIEGTKVKTEHGEVDTSYILFVCAGAFLQVKPSDLLAELQGRLPIRVKLADMTEDDMYRILTEPEANIILQQKALLKTEGVDLRFTDDSIREIARVAAEANRTVENIGARRLFTVIEKLMEDISYNAADYAGKVVVVDENMVSETYKKLFSEKKDLKHYII